MSKFTDQQYLKTDQYKDSSNLNARVEIHRRFSTNSYGWFNWVFDVLLKLPAQAKLLELGCGPAYMWQECSSRIPIGWDITNGFIWVSARTVGVSFTIQSSNSLDNCRVAWMMVEP